MLRNTFLSVLTVLAAAAASQAAVTITNNGGVATPGLAGFKTYIVTATSTDPITAFDFVGAGDNDPATGRGFFGAMNQLGPPLLATIFNDSNAILPALNPGHTSAEDSQFSVNSTTVVVPPGLAEESGTVLQAAWAWAAPQGLSIPFAQIVIPDTNTGGVSFRGAVTALVGGAQTDFSVSGTVGGGALPPVAPVVVDLNLGNRIQGAVVSHTFATSVGSTPITWGNLVLNGPAAPPNAPTLTGGGAFSWNSAGAAFGAYTFDATATNAGGSDVGRLSVNIVVPEPATMGLIGLAMIGLVAFGIRKR